DMRKIGSAGIETGWIASGRGEAFFVTKIDPWDIAAGVLLVKEAKGKVTDFSGNSWKLKSGDFLFSNKKLHNQLLKIISK
ncbi:inositol monophosphatase, partial [Candidatus Parcubacteria bacterium]|nr:inositol monophosphatase [Candidatus Parcubacteria bacterium]